MMRPRETTPLWVWVTFAMIGVGAATYLVAFFMIDDLMPMLK